MTPQRYPLQDTVVDAAEGVGLRFNSLGPWSQALAHQLQVHEPVWATFTGNGVHDCDMYLARVQDTSATSAEVACPAQQATEHFTLRDSQDHEFVLQPPISAVRPGSFRTPELAAPQLLQVPAFPSPTDTKPLPPPPYGGTLLNSSPDALVYQLNVSPHSLCANDLQAWECHSAHQLLRQESPQTVWVYLDGSAGKAGYGSAATVYLPDGTTFVLCLPSPFQTSGGAEFWAALMAVCWARHTLPRFRIHILGDNQQVVALFSPDSLAPPHPSSTTDGTWAWALKNQLPSLPPHVKVSAAWIKGHAGFQGNVVSDAFSKWIAYVCEWTPSLLPRPLGIISDGHLPIAHKVTPTHHRRLYPSHSNYNIHMGTSYDCYCQSSWFAIRPFKWVSGNLNISTWPLHDDLKEYPCHLCGGQHTMELLAQLALCPSADPILQLFLQAWPQLFNAIAQQWWSSSPHKGDKRNFVRTLVPLPLHRSFVTPSTGQSSSERRQQLREALPPRRAAKKRVIEKAVEWLRDTATPIPRAAPLTANTWGRANCHFSTSHTLPPAQDYKYSAPDPLTDSVRKPPHRAPKRPQTATTLPRSSRQRRTQPQQPTRRSAPKRPPRAPPPLQRKERTEFKPHCFSPPQGGPQPTCSQWHPSPQRTHTIHLPGKEPSTPYSLVSKTSHSQSHPNPVGNPPSRLHYSEARQ